MRPDPPIGWPAGLLKLSRGAGGQAPGAGQYVRIRPGSTQAAGRWPAWPRPSGGTDGNSGPRHAGSAARHEPAVAGPPGATARAGLSQLIWRRQDREPLPAAGMRDTRGLGDGRDVREDDRVQPRPGRFRAPARCLAPVLRGERHRGRRAAASGRRRAGRPHARPGARDGLLLRRRRGLRRRIPRMHEPGGAVGTARAVLLREQPLCHGHGTGAHAGTDRPCAAGRHVRDARLAGGRDGRHGRGARRAKRRGGGPGGGRAALPRAAHLPVPRPLHVRPRTVPGQGGSGAVAAPRPDRVAHPQPARRRRAVRRRARRDGGHAGRARSRRRSRRRGRPRPSRSRTSPPSSTARSHRRAPASRSRPPTARRCARPSARRCSETTGSS